MKADTLKTQEWFELLDETSLQLLQVVDTFPENKFNIIPFANCWSAAQVCEHIVKSNEAIAQMLNTKGETTERQPDQRALELKELFLDFARKFQSAETLLPTEAVYDKETIIENLEKSFANLRELRTMINLHETAEVPGFGELTKLELLCLVNFHTQKHIHQIKKLE